MLMVSASLSASACDLSCWLRETPSDCHSGGSATEDKQGMMYASSAMDMSSEAEMGSHSGQRGASADHIVNADARHSMSADMDMVRNSLQANAKSEVRSSGAFDYKERSKGLSPCSHETCSQASASTSPPRASPGQPAYLHAAIDVLSPANVTNFSYRIAPGRPPSTNLAVDRLATLRI